MNLAGDIKRKAIELGFELVGITDASPLDTEQAELLADWLKAGHAGRMRYMHKNFEKRIDPSKLLKDARSVICLGLNYKPTKPPASLRASQSDTRHSRHLCSPDTLTGKVAGYAQYQDYHTFIKKQLRRLMDFITSLAGISVKFKICVDSVPLAERALAARAGLGFIGKNHMLINPMLGPQIFLGEIITTLKLQIDQPITNNCSNCSKCIQACPAGALQPDGRFDANKCISYLTIEYKDRIPDHLAEKIGDWLVGCDECVLTCPYQNTAPACKNRQFKFYPDRAELNLQDVLNLSRQDFETEFADSAIGHLGLEKLKTNAQICLKNVTG